MCCLMRRLLGQTIRYRHLVESDRYLLTLGRWITHIGPRQVQVPERELWVAVQDCTKPRLIAWCLEWFSMVTKNLASRNRSYQCWFYTIDTEVID